VEKKLGILREFSHPIAKFPHPITSPAYTWAFWKNAPRVSFKDFFVV
jgi:hypothetical protein